MSWPISFAEGPLVARTRPVDHRRDEVAALEPGGFAWWHGGVGFVANGVAAVLDPSEVAGVLTRIEVADEVGCPATGAIAVGALGFNPARAPTMVVPAMVLGVAPDGRRWITEIGPADRPVHSPRAAPRPRRFEIREGMSRPRWSRAVEDVLVMIGAGELEKVVLARDVTVTADDVFDVALLVDRLRQTQAVCYVFASRGLVGASPELLVLRQGEVVQSVPMAGTATLAGGIASDRLGASDKNQWEHRLVVEALVSRLSPFCSSGPTISPPEVRTFTDVAHLATMVEGQLRPEPPSVVDLALALHPTPAVAGTPTERALEAISRLEGKGRGRYAGPVGWVDAAGDGEMALALRCAEITGNTAVLHAGAGIVQQSDPDEEWRETEVKLEPMLRVLTRS